MLGCSRKLKPMVNTTSRQKNWIKPEFVVLCRSVGFWFAFSAELVGARIFNMFEKDSSVQYDVQLG